MKRMINFLRVAAKGATLSFIAVASCLPADAQDMPPHNKRPECLSLLMTTPKTKP